MKKALIYTAVVVAMIGSVALIGFFGPLVVSGALTMAARRYQHS